MVQKRSSLSQSRSNVSQNHSASVQHRSNMSQNHSSAVQHSLGVLPRTDKTVYYPVGAWCGARVDPIFPDLGQRENRYDETGHPVQSDYGRKNDKKELMIPMILHEQHDMLLDK